GATKRGGVVARHREGKEEAQAPPHEPHSAVATAAPDEAKGERLIAFYTDPELSPQEIWEQLGDSSLPKLWIPKREDIRFIESIPTLGTGKVDLRAVRALASRER